MRNKLKHKLLQPPPLKFPENVSKIASSLVTGGFAQGCGIRQWFYHLE
jgi:hypothetical protein